MLNLWTPIKALRRWEWMDQYFVMPAEISSTPGKWKTWGYQKGILDAMSDVKNRRVVVMKPVQSGYSLMITGSQMCDIVNNPTNIICAQPTIEDIQGYSKDAIESSIREMPSLQNLIVNDDSKKNKKSTILRKSFPGGRWNGIGANSGRGFRRLVAERLYADEVDEWPPEVKGQGDQLDLLEKRGDSYETSMLIEGSTCTVKGFSRIERDFEKSDKRYRFLPCPHCGFKQTLKFSNMDWSNKGTIERPVIVCENEDCSVGYFEQKHLEWMDDDDHGAEWMATAPFHGIAGFHFWAAYSRNPKASWKNIVREWLDAQGDRMKLKVFINTRLAETFDEGEGEKLDGEALYNRREDYEEIMPLHSYFLTAAVDVQKDRLEILVKAWGYDYESWDLSHVVILGNTAQPHVWDSLDKFRQKLYPHMNGSQYPIHCMVIDTGYKPTEEGRSSAAASIVTEYARKRQMQNVYAIKGANVIGKPIVPPKPSRRNKSKINLYEIGVHAGKDLLESRLTLKNESGGRCPGYIHLPTRFSLELCKQLSSEKKLPKYKSGRFLGYAWQKEGGKRNELWDLEVYSIGAIHIRCPDAAILNQYVDIAAKGEAGTTSAPAKRKSTAVNIWD